MAVAPGHITTWHVAAAPGHMTKWHMAESSGPHDRKMLAIDTPACASGRAAVAAGYTHHLTRSCRFLSTNWPTEVDRLKPSLRKIATACKPRQGSKTGGPLVKVLWVYIVLGASTRRTR